MSIRCAPQGPGLHAGFWQGAAGSLRVWGRRESGSEGGSSCHPGRYLAAREKQPSEMASFLSPAGQRELTPEQFRAYNLLACNPPACDPLGFLALLSHCSFLSLVWDNHKALILKGNLGRYVLRKNRGWKWGIGPLAIIRADLCMSGSLISIDT